MSSGFRNNAEKAAGVVMCSPVSSCSDQWAVSDEKITETKGSAMNDYREEDTKKTNEKDDQDSLVEKEKPKIERKHHLPKTFPILLHELLADKDFQHIIRWLPDGDSFVIMSRERLVKEALPRYFKESKYLSFTRKLNRWGFKRTVSDIYPNEIVFFHRLFVRDDPSLCDGMSGARDQGRERSTVPHPGNTYSATVGRHTLGPVIQSDPRLLQLSLPFQASSIRTDSDLVGRPMLSNYETPDSVLLGSARRRLEEVEALRMVEIDARRRAAALLQAPVGVPTALQTQALGRIDDLRGVSSHPLLSLQSDRDVATRLELQALLLRRRQAEQNDRFFRLLGRPYP